MKVSCAVVNVQAFSEITQGKWFGNYYHYTAVVLHFNNESQIERLTEYIHLITDISFIWMAVVAPGVEPFAAQTYVPPFCQFLVIRQVDDNIFNVTEFYRIGNPIFDSQWGTWSRETKISLASREPLLKRRRDFNGAVFTAFYKPGAVLQGWYWVILEEFHNFTTQYKTLEEARKAGESFHVLVVNELWDPREFQKDTVGPLGRSTYFLFMKRPAEDVSFWKSYLRPFTLNAWVVILLLTLLILISIPVLKVATLKMKIQTADGEFDPVGYGCLTFDTLMGQNGMGGMAMASASSFRIAFFVTICSATLLRNLYSGELISYITTHEYTIPYSDITEFVQDGSYNVTFQEVGSASKLMSRDLGPVVGNYVKTHYTEFPGYSDLPKELCKERFAYVGESRVINDYYQSNGWPCEVVPIPRPLETIYVGLFLAPNSEFTSAFRYVLVLLRESGFIDYAHQQYYGSSSRHNGATDLTEVDIPRIVPALILLVLGGAFSVCILLLELLLIRYVARERTHKVRRVAWKC